MPNIWVAYLINNSKTNECSSLLNKFSKIYNIKDIIRLDTDVNYWLKSSNYINNIKLVVLNDEISKLIKYYKCKNDVIKNNYYNNIETLIISNSNFEITIGLLINFRMKFCNVTIKEAYNILQYNINKPIKLSEEMKRLIIIYNQ